MAEVNEYGEVIETPDPNQTEQQNKSYIAAGGIDDDSGTIQRFKHLTMGQH